MCGITGVFLPHGQVQADVLTRMRDSLQHRGPDSDGLYFSPDRRLGLGFRRLSILDLSAASNQPLQSADGQYAIVFNGEIFNFRKLKADLAARGHRFGSDGDAEVVLHAFMEYGA